MCEGRMGCERGLAMGETVGSVLRAPADARIAPSIAAFDRTRARSPALMARSAAGFFFACCFCFVGFAGCFFGFCSTRVTPPFSASSWSQHDRSPSSMS